MLLSRLRKSLWMQSLKARVFALAGRHYSNHRWYGPYRDIELKNALLSPFNGALPAGYGRWLDERLVEYPWFFSQVPQDAKNLLDAGSTLNHNFILDHAALRDKKITIMTLAPEENSFPERGISYLYGDLRHTPFPDESFDCVACLSVLEHIGLDTTIYSSTAGQVEHDPEGYRAAVAEFRRVLKPGGSCLITIPFGHRDVRSWVQVLDAAMVARIVADFRPSQFAAQYFRYTENEDWQVSTQAECSGAVYFDLNHDVPWPGCPAAAGAVACLHLVK
jgi:SAM-dependent methyltransferase